MRLGRLLTCLGGAPLAFSIAAASPVAATPDLASARPIGTLTVYSDDRHPDLFYYGPGAIRVAKGPDGKPDIHFLQMRYTSSAPRGTRLRRSLLSFRVTMAAPSASELAATRPWPEIVAAMEIERHPWLEQLAHDLTEPRLIVDAIAQPVWAPDLIGGVARCQAADFIALGCGWRSEAAKAPASRIVRHVVRATPRPLLTV